MTHLNASALVSAGFSANTNANGRAILPVSPSNYIYAHFKHVSGVPAQDGVRGIAISKLKMLDSIIERISRQGAPKVPQETPYDKKPPTPSGGLLNIAA